MCVAAVGAAGGGAEAAGAEAGAGAGADAGDEAAGAGAVDSEAAADELRRFDAEDVGWDAAAGVAAAAGALPTVTSGVIFLIVAAETPAFDKSLVDE